MLIFLCDSGLDLSFLTHIFLIEPIADAALLEQVTSRAHRLGATGPVRIETVNCFYELSHGTQTAIASNQLISHSIQKERDEEKEKELTKVVCQYCYREYPSHAEAEEHEQGTCPRNPNSTSFLDRFHLSSVYREIRAPPATLANPDISQGNQVSAIR